MNINADLHIHSRFSGGTSKNMTLELLSDGAKKKGVDIVATGDCLHSKWLSEIKALNKIDEGTFELNNTRFLSTTEVEDNKRVHHLLIFPSISSVHQFKEGILNFSPNIETDGRPNVNMNGEEIAQLAKDCEALIGPCHAFTPWTAMYAYHDSLNSCYGDLTDYISYVELGLSADTNYADKIKELDRLTFLTNSDAHSPYPVRLAREFNRLQIEDLTFDEVKKALLRKGGRKAILNVGLPPQKGKYNESACIKCFKHYTLTEAIMKKWKCTCGKRIKKGVKDRIEELSTYPDPKHPEHRPQYIHVIPLAEIISKAIGHSSPFTKGVVTQYEKLIKAFNNEVTVLLEAEIEKINKITDEKITNAIEAFRMKKIIVHPGGGGEYGKIEIPEDFDFNNEIGIKDKQHNLFGFSDKEKKEKQQNLFDY